MLQCALSYSQRIWRRPLQGLELAHTLVETLIDKKGSNILLLDITDQAIFTDYFILCNGDNRRQINALADALLEAAREKCARRPRGNEGDPATGWVLVDFGDVIVHLFAEEQREYYNLEELWADAQVVLRVQ
ncbi:MAG: ribosome silencing factor [Anaerolineae bacterium]|nr:ribosome silencing factor [Anaerolineae bacterium]